MFVCVILADRVASRTPVCGMMGYLGRGDWLKRYESHAKLWGWASRRFKEYPSWIAAGPSSVSV